MMWVHWESLSGTDLLDDVCFIEELDSFFRNPALQPFSCLKYSDYYDDTLYNYRQVSEVEKELAVVATLDLPESARKELDALIEFIGRVPCDERKGNFLKFLGE